MANFCSGALPILLATNVAARGLDVAGIGQVINYELPESAEWFTHRVGRTGRMGRAGKAITLLTPDDTAKWRQMRRRSGASSCVEHGHRTVRSASPVPIRLRWEQGSAEPQARQQPRPLRGNRRRTRAPGTRSSDGARAFSTASRKPRRNRSIPRRRLTRARRSRPALERTARSSK